MARILISRCRGVKQLSFQSFGQYVVPFENFQGAINRQGFDSVSAARGRGRANGRVHLGWWDRRPPRAVARVATKDVRRALQALDDAVVAALARLEADAAGIG